MSFLIFLVFQCYILYVFTNSDRDVFNEKPTREEIVAATQVSKFIVFFFLFLSTTFIACMDLRNTALFS